MTLSAEELKELGEKWEKVKKRKNRWENQIVKRMGVSIRAVQHWKKGDRKILSPEEQRIRQILRI